jgi:hypothetical protein
MDVLDWDRFGSDDDSLLTLNRYVFLDSMRRANETLSRRILDHRRTFQSLSATRRKDW